MLEIYTALAVEQMQRFRMKMNLVVILCERGPSYRARRKESVVRARAFKKNLDFVRRRECCEWFLLIIRA